MIKFIGQIQTFLDMADEYWGKSKKTGEMEHSLECETHGVLLHSSWFPAEEWNTRSKAVKFCHYCGKRLKITATEVIQDHIGHGNLQLLIWDEKFRQETLDELNGKKKPKPPEYKPILVSVKNPGEK